MPGFTVMVPSGFITRPGFGLAPGISATFVPMSPVVSVTPFNVSLTITLAVVAPDAPLMPVYVSGVATIGAAATVTVTVADAQLEVLAFSQIV